MTRPTHTAPRSLLLTLIGRLVCKWKGGHKWGRAHTASATEAVSVLYEKGFDGRVKTCQRCGLTKPIKTRAKRVKQEVSQ